MLLLAQLWPPANHVLVTLQIQFRWDSFLHVIPVCLHKIIYCVTLCTPSYSSKVSHLLTAVQGRRSPGTIWMACSLISSSSPNDSGYWERERDGDAPRELEVWSLEVFKTFPRHWLNYSSPTRWRPRARLRLHPLGENNSLGWHWSEMPSVLP